MTTLGADPELFLRDESNQLVSAIGKFGGTKKRPKKFGDRPGFAVQEDNVAVEFNIPPSPTKEAFVQNIKYALEELEKRAATMKLKLAIEASGEFPDKELKHRRAKIFGCDPDFNVWSLQPNPRPHTTNPHLRSAGGHVHIGDTTDRIGLGRACDLFLGCPSIVFDGDRNRRLLYGKAGAIRHKPYGLEYRTLSNFWVKSPELTEMIWNQTMQARNFMYNGQRIPDEDGMKIVACINNSDQDLLRELTKKYKLRY